MRTCSFRKIQRGGPFLGELLRRRNAWPAFRGPTPWQSVRFVWGQQALTYFVALVMLFPVAMTFSRSRAGITLTRLAIMR